LPTFPACSDLGLDRRILTSLPGACVPARVVAVHRGACTVLGDGPPRLATTPGRLRHAAQRQADLPAVGDWVALDRSGGAVISAIADRRGVIARTDPQTGSQQILAAHVDVALIVTSANRELNARRIERFVALAAAGGADPVILLNKTDLSTSVHEALGRVRHAVGGALPVLPISALTGAGLETVAAVIGSRRTGVLLGSSGVGKSTLINALLGEARQSTASIRGVDDRGRHTTVRRELFMLPGGALLIDTPGLKLPRMTADAHAAAFDELTRLADTCRFADCRHEAEPGCAVRAALADGRLDPDRLEAARRLQREAEWADSRSDPKAQRARERARRRTIRINNPNRDSW